MWKRRVHTNGSSYRGGGRTTANNAKIVYYEDEDEDDDGWVHGGKYVPPNIASVPRASSSSKIKAHADSASIAAAPPATTASARSPNSTLSPVSPRTPPASDQHRGGAATTAAAVPRTPLTIQLKRLLRPAAPHTIARPTTPSTTTPTIASPATASEFDVNAMETSTTIFETFLRQCGVTPHLSHAIGNFFYRLALLILPLLDFLYDATLSVWNTTLVTILPNFLCDLIESICEMTADFSHLVWKILRFALPFLVWITQTCVASSLAVGGTILWLLSISIRGRKRAQESGAGNMQSSAMKSLRESMRNSPFGKSGSGGGRRGRLPFSGFTNRYPIPTPQRDGMHAMLASSIAASTAITTTTTRMDSNNARAVVVPPPSSSSKSSTPATTIASAMRSSNARSSNLKRTAANPREPSANDQSISTITNTVRTPSTATTRRVLFFETEAGEVLTDVTTFDKNMPASARKDRDYHPSSEGSDDGNGGELLTKENGVVLNTMDDRQTGLGLASSKLDSTLPSQATKTSTQKSSQPTTTSISAEEKASSFTSGQKEQPHQSSNSIIHKSDSTEARDRKEQQYTITPLSKRYAQMKLSQLQQRQKEYQRGKMPSVLDVSAAANNNNPTRKRRGELLGAASRLGRQRRARLMNATAGASFLNRNRNPNKRRREDDDFLARTDDLIWRALNHDGKENNQILHNQEGGTTAKRGKFNSNISDEVISNTPSKNPTGSSSTPLAQITTPPTSPEPSKFNWANSVMATPGLKKTNNRGRGDSDEIRGSTATLAGVGGATTPFKPSLPLAFDDYKEDDDDDHIKKKDGAARLSFGPTSTADAEANVANGSFAFAREGTSESKKLFSNSSDFASVTKTTESQQSNSAAPSTAFAFGHDIASSSSVSASSSVITSASSVISTPAPFAFEGVSQSTAPALPRPTLKLPVLGNSGVASVAATASNTPAPFAFGSSSQPTSIAPTLATASQPASSAVAFGNSVLPSGALSFGIGAASTPSAASSTFPFGSVNMAGNSAPAAAGGLPAQTSSSFTFGAPSAGGVPPFSAASTNTFRLGGGVSSSGAGGASARRRAAKASGGRS